MLTDHPIDPSNIRIDPVDFLSKFHTTVDVARLDLLHPIISGNKWFKLKAHLKEAGQLRKKNLVTFGGAFSNHIVATAAAARQYGFKSTGIIRGEEPRTLSPTLQEAMRLGMELHFVSREAYKNKILPEAVGGPHNEQENYVIAEGGYGPRGVEGAVEILQQLDAFPYSHVAAAVGTGTTLAGLTEASQSHQKVTGISIMKNNYSLQQEIASLVSTGKQDRFVLLHGYDFGGYAKRTPGLISFMNEWYRLTGIPSDFVYTGKLFFALNDLMQKNYFPPDSKILIIHSGGLQGNLSLPKGTLIF